MPPRGLLTRFGLPRAGRRACGPLPVSGSFAWPDAWPGAGDEERAAAALLRWKGAAARLPDEEDRAFAESLPGTPAGEAMLRCVFGGSPFLESCLLAEPGFSRRLWSGGPDAAFAEVLANLRALPCETSEESARRALRVARRRAALCIALADISGTWGLPSVTGALSLLADTACSTALRVLLARLVARGVLAAPDPGNPETGSGLIVLGLGKLGGHELNYSSDIDLILLYEPDAVPARRGEDVERHLVRLARRFVALLAERTADGYVFRVDLRLRPDPSATPLVVSAVAARHYYQERGRTWERAALIKARPIAGDIAAGRDFLDRIAGFVWRRNLDFATVQELHDIKRQIDARHGGGSIHPHGHDLKLGRGGVREIEFFAQTHQLIWGGKERALRVIPTCEVLRTLADTGRIPKRVADGFIVAYRFLRRAEHRVQMTRDEQTHALPQDPDAFGVLARFLGYAEEDAFVSRLVEHLQEVERYYTELFELPLEVTSAAAPDPEAAETLGRLERLGFAHPGAAAALLARWKSDAYPALRAPRSRELLDALTPALLTAMVGTWDPDRALERFDHLLSQLPDALQMLALFQANLHVMEHIAEIMVSAPALAERLAERPALFEALLESETDPKVPDCAGLEEDLHLRLEPAGEDEDPLSRLHFWADATDLRILAHILFRRLDPLDEPALRDAASDCALRALLARVAAALAAEHGRIDEAECALLVLNRPGARNTSIASGRDLVLIHDAPEHLMSDGGEPLAAPDYYRDLLRRLGGSAHGGRGKEEGYRPGLLPPDGASVVRWATSLCAFERHCAERASLPERAALIRSRVPAGDETIAARVRETVDGVLRAPCEAGRGSGSAAPLVRAESWWRALRHRGGLAELESFIQDLQAHWAHAHPDLVTGDTGEAIRRLEHHALLAPDDARSLLDAWRLGVRVRALRGLVSEDVEMEDVPEGLRSRFAGAAGVQCFRELEARLEGAAAELREVRARPAVRRREERALV